MEHSKVDRTIFTLALILIGSFTVPVLINPEKGTNFLDTVLGFIGGNFGSLYLIAGFAIFVALMYLAVSKYGGIVLGDKSEKPEFSTGSWIALIFTSTAGSSLLYWGFME